MVRKSQIITTEKEKCNDGDVPRTPQVHGAEGGEGHGFWEGLSLGTVKGVRVEGSVGQGSLKVGER